MPSGTRRWYATRPPCRWATAAFHPNPSDPPPWPGRARAAQDRRGGQSVRRRFRSAVWFSTSAPQGSRRGRAISSAGERFVHTEEVTGSIPVSPTARQGPVLIKEPALSHVCDVRFWEQNGSDQESAVTLTLNQKNLPRAEPGTLDAHETTAAVHLGAASTAPATTPPTPFDAAPAVDQAVPPATAAANQPSPSNARGRPAESAPTPAAAAESPRPERDAPYARPA